MEGPDGRGLVAPILDEDVEDVAVPDRRPEGFLRFGAAHGWVTPATVAMLSERRTLIHLPAGFDPNEDGQWRTLDKAAFRFALTDPGYQDLSTDQIAAMITAARTARDRFLIALLACTGLRIGEGLGLHQEGLHPWPPHVPWDVQPRARISTSGAARTIRTEPWPSPATPAPCRLSTLPENRPLPDPWVLLTL
ncbi:hypothetical protein ACFWB2_42805 [Streptomyces virginiae]|uniref:hypothetical protein n=1 Tax=Streptomyces virginiae TaxID=1961 RepID=UPI0036939765